MNNFILGNSDFLEHKKSLTILLISDSHGNIPVLESIIAEFAPSCDMLVFCGDGAADFWQIFSAAAVFDGEDGKLALPPFVALARGNGDFINYPMHDFSSIFSGDTQYRKFHFQVPERVLFSSAGKMILAEHGHKYDVGAGIERLAAAASIMDADLVFYGHTHVPAISEVGGTVFVNPGSCSLPRGGKPACFAVVSFPGTVERFDVRFYEIGYKGGTRGASFEFKPFHP
ncbi:MAG: metallophosphoesterase [Treponemataceae bacterium]|nr:MAG: metallophosphoesterase [Treponemataceae bacterium]